MLVAQSWFKVLQPRGNNDDVVNIDMEVTFGPRLLGDDKIYTILSINDTNDLGFIISDYNVGWFTNSVNQDCTIKLFMYFIYKFLSVTTLSRHNFYTDNRTRANLWYQHPTYTLPTSVNVSLFAPLNTQAIVLIPGSISFVSRKKFASHVCRYINALKVQGGPYKSVALYVRE